MSTLCVFYSDEATPSDFQVEMGGRCCSFRSRKPSCFLVFSATGNVRPSPAPFRPFRFQHLALHIGLFPLAEPHVQQPFTDKTKYTPVIVCRTPTVSSRSSSSKSSGKSQSQYSCSSSRRAMSILKRCPLRRPHHLVKGRGIGGAKFFDHLTRFLQVALMMGVRISAE